MGKRTIFIVQGIIRKKRLFFSTVEFARFSAARSFSNSAMMASRFKSIFLLAIFVLLLAGNFCSAEVFEENVETNGQYDAPESPLFHAASVGNLGVIQHELSLGTDVNVRNDDDWTPLMFAVESNSLHAVSLVSRARPL